MCQKRLGTTGVTFVGMQQTIAKVKYVAQSATANICNCTVSAALLLRDSNCGGSRSANERNDPKYLTQS